MENKDLKTRIAEWQKNPARTYEEGVKLLKEGNTRWARLPHFDRKQDWPKLFYELEKLNPSGVPDSTGQKVVDNAEIKEPTYKMQAIRTEEKTVEESGTVNLAGKINRETLEPNAQALYDKYIDAYNVCISLHESLKRAATDEERKEQLEEVIKQDKLCGELWEELQNEIYGLEEKEVKGTEKAVDPTKAAFEAGKRMKLLKNGIARDKKDIKDKKLTGKLLQKKNDAIAKKQAELDSLIATYGQQ